MSIRYATLVFIASILCEYCFTSCFVFSGTKEDHSAIFASFASSSSCDAMSDRVCSDNPVLFLDNVWNFGSLVSRYSFTLADAVSAVDEMFHGFALLFIAARSFFNTSPFATISRPAFSVSEIISTPDSTVPVCGVCVSATCSAVPASNCDVFGLVLYVTPSLSNAIFVAVVVSVPPVGVGFVLTVLSYLNVPSLVEPSKVIFPGPSLILKPSKFASMICFPEVIFPIQAGDPFLKVPSKDNPSLDTFPWPSNTGVPFTTLYCPS